MQRSLATFLFYFLFQDYILWSAAFNALCKDTSFHLEKNCIVYELALLAFSKAHFFFNIYSFVIHYITTTVLNL